MVDIHLPTRRTLVKSAGATHQHLGEISINTPIPTAIGIGQGRKGNTGAKTKVVKLVPSRLQADNYIAKAFPKGQLSEPKAKELLPTS